jgi:hypothetical protein
MAAIPTDATQDNQNENEPIPNLNDPTQHFSRDVAMKAMAARRRETVVADIDPADLPPRETETPEPVVDPGKQVAAQTRMIPDEELGTTLVRIKVNGEEQDVTLDELRRTAQKNAAADRALADANRLREQMTAEMAAWTQTKTQAPATAAPATPDDRVEKIRASAGETIGKMFTGDDTGATESLVAAIVAALPPPTAQAPAIDVKEIARQVTQQVTIDGALRQFVADFGDVMESEERKLVADRQLFIATGGKALEELPPAEVAPALERAGRMTRKWFDLPEPKATTGTQATARAEKAARKAGIDELPAAATRAASTLPPPQTTADVIAKMKAARGQVFRDPTQR